MRRTLLAGVVLLALVGAYQLGSRSPVARPSGADREPPAAVMGIDGASQAANQRVASAGVVPAASLAEVAMPPRDGAMSSSAPLAPNSIAGSLMSQGMLNPRAMSAVDADDFDKLIARARREADAEALRTTDAYRRILATGLADLPGEPRVDDMACTYRVCLLAVSRRPVEKASVDWMAILGEPTSDTSLKVGALVDGEKALPGGRLESRVVFAIGTSGFIVGPPR